MNLLEAIKNVGSGIAIFGKFVAKIWDSVEEMDKAWHALPPESKRSLLAIGSDIYVLIVDAEQEWETKGLNLALDKKTYEDLKKLVSDARAGQSVALTGLNALGVYLTLPKPTLTA